MHYLLRRLPDSGFLDHTVIGCSRVRGTIGTSVKPWSRAGMRRLAVMVGTQVNQDQPDVALLMVTAGRR